MKKLTTLLFVVTIALTTLTGCTKQEAGTSLGAAAGAGIGYTLGGGWGAAAGAAGGAAVGNKVSQ
jgi:osmotically inducible lipoprotein OsmB